MAVAYQIIQTDIVKCEPDWQWHSDRNGWTGYHIWSVIGGGASIWKNGETFKLSPGDCFFFDLSQNHICTHDPKFPLYVETVYFHSDTPLQIKQFHIQNNMALNTAVCRCVTLHRYIGYTQAELWLQAAVSEFLNSYNEMPKTPEKARVDEWCSRIEDDCCSPFSLDDFCKKVGYSKNQFIRLFKAYTGKTPYQYYVRCKIQKSASLLLYTNHTINEISSSMGFYDLAHFSRCFKKIMGYSPTQIRKKV